MWTQNPAWSLLYLEEKIMRVHLKNHLKFLLRRVIDRHGKPHHYKGGQHH
ncbi:hypothetical protein HMPREF1992_00077 [Selenomonas sp. oral taxon 892 str. F0426]|nr:hypothetical protein HMPREF1992_00077 [Selenomonas sp. oral taxon 892 str. F0426]